MPRPSPTEAAGRNGPRERPPHLLFLPVCGGEGTGEYARCLILAEGARRRWPAARIRIVATRGPGAAPEDGFERHWMEGSPTRNTPAVRALLEGDPPDVALFDNSGRTAQLRCARRLGVRSVFVTSRPTTRWRGFQLRRLRRLDQIWIVQPRSDLASLNPWERLKLRLLSGTEALFLDTIHPEPDPARLEALRRTLGLRDEPYLLFAPGGGGWQVGGRPVSEIFVEAARQAARESRMRAVVVLGPRNPAPAAGLGRVLVVGALRPAEMMDLIAGARLLAIGGGSILGQALSLGRVCVAAAAGGRDQEERVRRWAREGALEAAETEPGAIARAVLGLLGEPARLDAVRARVEALGLRNGLPSALDALGRLVAKPRPGRG